MCKTETIQIRVSPEEKERLQSLAVSFGSMTNMILTKCLNNKRAVFENTEFGWVLKVDGEMVDLSEGNVHFFAGHYRDLHYEVEIINPNQDE